MAELNPDQNRVLEALLAGENAFVTGRAGVGKSYLVKHLCQELDKLGKSHVLLAPTGVAAINIGGQTIHRFLRLRPEIKTIADYVRSVYPRTRNVRDKLAELDVIIIDEISMVHPDLFQL